MSDLQKKLNALRESAGLVTGAEILARGDAPTRPIRPLETPRPTTPDSPDDVDGGGLRGRLARLGVERGRDGSDAQAPVAATVSAWDVDVLFPGDLVGPEEAACYRIRTEFPIEHRHGQSGLDEVLGVAAKHLAFSSADDAMAGFDPRAAAFIDTETTGLAGGAGTVPFLVGAGYFVGDVFRLDQYFLRDYHEEAAMLADLAENLGEVKTLVSYNGKSFDLPLLRTRFVQQRIAFPWEGAAHLDLVHASRRFWRRRLRDCSLGNIEREILGIHREDDVPSYLIPQRWFEYLHSRDARPLDGVFYHHRMDILSLVTLTGWLALCLEAPEGRGFEHAEDRLSMIRLHFRQKSYDDVIRLGEAFKSDNTGDVLVGECCEMLALAYKRRNEFEEMEAAWEALLQLRPAHPRACVELAKHHEHRTRNLERAVVLCADALDDIDERIGMGRAPGLNYAEIEAIRSRLERLRRKIRKARPEEAEFDYG